MKNLRVAKLTLIASGGVRHADPCSANRRGRLALPHFLGFLASSSYNTPAFTITFGSL
jgi:hypothetical protein